MLVSVSVFGQGSEIDITNFQYAVRGDERICENRIELLAKFRNSVIEQRLFFTEGQGEGDYVFNDISRSFSTDIIESIHVVVYTREKRGGRRCRSGLGSVLEIDEYIPVDMDPCDNGFFFKDQRNGGDFEVRHVMAFSWSVKPLVTLTRVGSDIAGYEDIFRATGAPGYNPSVFKWQYQMTDFGTAPRSNGWIDIPGVPRGKDLAVRPDSFLPISEIGRELHIRTYSCFGSTPSPSISYKLRRSAPHIINDNPEDVLCYDSIDGKVTLTFDRALEPGDNFNVSIVDLSKPDGTAPNGDPLFEEVRAFNNVSFTAGNQLVLDGLPSSNPLPDGFRVDIIGGGFNGVPYFTEGADHTLIFEIGRPVPVAFVGEPGADENIVDVWCINGSDGEIALEAIGGIGANQYYEYLIRSENEAWGTNWIRFSEQFTHTIKNLPADTYYIKIRDAHECVAKVQTDIGGGEIRLGEEIIKQVVIEEPDAPVDFEFDLVNEPRAFGFEDGRISARIFGGTAFADGSYTFEWKNEAGEVLTTTNTEVLSGDQGYQIILHSVGKGVYNLSVWDANFDPATDKEGCFFLNADYSLGEPTPLEVKIEIQNPISCNITNEYSNGEDFVLPYEQPDQFHDGALVATVTGGVPFDKLGSTNGQCRSSLRRYCYTWKKEINGIWEEVKYPNGDKVNDSLIEFQSVGNYALNIVDARGIELGDYEEYFLSDGSREYRVARYTDSLRYLPQPDKLELSFTKNTVTCAEGNNGEASVTVKGGVGPYTYDWSTGATTSNIDGLFSGKYNVKVIDSKGCEVKGSVTIEQPNGLQIETQSAIAPTCFEGNDGSIEVSIEGGVKPYQLRWDTGSTLSRITNLSEGTYVLEVTDANGCKAFYQETIVDPDPIVVNMLEKRSLCDDQALNLDIAIDDAGARYEWISDNGFTSSSSTVEITEAGIYTATITSSLGCIGVGSIAVEVFDTPIDADFLLTTQAYTDEEVILVNVSEPVGDKVEWTVPDAAEIIEKDNGKLIVKFTEEGPYDILLTSYQGDCFQEYTKTILVQPAIETPEGSNTQGQFIEEFIVYPNPNNGSFKTKITLAEDSNITVKIVSLMSGMTVNERSEKNQQDFLLDYTLSMPTGVYLMLLETPKGSETRKIVFE